MMKKIIQLSKCIGVLLLLVLVGSGVYVVYMNLPTGTDVELSKKPKERLRELIFLADLETEVNNNLFASSTYQPNDSLYKAIVAIQSDRWGEAVEILTPMVELGDPEAMFWLGEITYSSNAFSDGGKWFLESAKLGNPYAAMKLSPRYNITNDCDLWLRNYCDEQWGIKGLYTFNKRIDDGDVKAAYAIWFYTRYENTGAKSFEQLLRIAKEGMKVNYFRPIHQIIKMYHTRESLNPFIDDVIPLNESDKRELVKLLMFSVNNNDVVSIGILNDNYKNNLDSLLFLNEAINRIYGTNQNESSFLETKPTSPITFIDELGGARDYMRGGF